MKLYHVSDCNFKSFNPSKSSVCGDFGDGHYAYITDVISYGITMGNFLLEFELNSNKILKLDSCPTIEILKENNAFDYDCDFDAVIVNDVIVLKKGSLSKISFCNSLSIVDVSSREWNKAPLLFELSDGRVLSTTGVY